MKKKREGFTGQKEMDVEDKKHNRYNLKKIRVEGKETHSQHCLFLEVRIQ
jgi:hypothetical protein